MGCGTWTVGRVDCSINVVNDLSISRKHATLTVTQDGDLHIQDNQSKYGTFLSAIRIEGRMVLSNDAEVEGKMLRFGAGKSEYAIRRETWRAALIGQVEKGALIPKRELVDRELANIIILGNGFMQECRKEELLDVALAWVRKVPIVSASFLECLPRVPVIGEHVAVLPFSPKRLEQCTGIYSPGREELISGFNGTVSADPRDHVDSALLVEFLYEQRPDLPQLPRAAENEPKQYEASRVNVVYDSLFRKGPVGKRFKKVQPERALPVIIDLVESSKTLVSPLPKASSKNDFESIKTLEKTSAATSTGRRKRKMPLFEDYQQQQVEQVEPTVVPPEPVKENFQSDFFKNL